MKNKKMNAVVVWKQIEDWLVPGLRLSVADRSVYYHLVRHSRLEGKSRLRFSLRWLASAMRMTPAPVRDSLRRLAANGALRIVERSKAGHVAELRLPEEMRGTVGGEASSPEFIAAKTGMHGGRSRKASDSGAGPDRGSGFHAQPAVEKSHSRARARAMLLLLTPGGAPDAVPGPRAAAGANGTEFVSQSGFLLPGMQRPEGRDGGTRFFALAVSRAKIVAK